MKLQDLDPVIIDESNPDNFDVPCKKCAFNEMSDECPKGRKLPLCFAQENTFRKPIYFKFKQK